MSDQKRLIFDLTTSSLCYGPPSGIVRTERALGRMAGEVTSIPVSYSIYDVRSQSYYALKPQVYERIMAGTLVVEPSREHVTPIPNEIEVALSDKMIAFENAIEARLELSSADTLVSCGADWQGKDLHAVFREKKQIGFRYVAVCYDVIPWRSPHYWPTGVAETVVSYYSELARLADRVICISQTTMREYSELCTEMEIPVPNLAVFRLGESDLGQSAAGGSRQASLPQQIHAARYVLMVASIEPRKNHWLLYHVWEDLLVRKSIDPDMKLVFVGADSWMTDDLLRQTRAHPILGQSIVILHGVSDEQLDLLYKNCLFTVYPSFHEGWGLPVAESLKYGKVCISSNRGSLAEISPLTVLLDPLDLYAWRDAIRDYILDNELRQNRERLISDEFTPTSWEQSAHQFFAAVMAP